MGSLKLDVGLGHMTDDSMVIGQASLPGFTKLSPNNPLSLVTSVINPQGLCLGKLHLTMAIELVKDSVKRVGPPVVKPLPLFREIEPPDLHCDEESIHNDQTIVPQEQELAKQTATKKRDYADDQTSVLPGTELVAGNSHQYKATGLGPQQLMVVSELIDHGNRLRDEMVQALGHCVDHDEEDQ